MGTSDPALIRAIAAERDQAAQIETLRARLRRADTDRRDTIATYRDLMEAPSA